MVKSKQKKRAKTVKKAVSRRKPKTWVEFQNPYEGLNLDSLNSNLELDIKKDSNKELLDTIETVKTLLNLCVYFLNETTSKQNRT